MFYFLKYSYWSYSMIYCYSDCDLSTGTSNLCISETQLDSCLYDCGSKYTLLKDYITKVPFNRKNNYILTINLFLGECTCFSFLLVYNDHVPARPRRLHPGLCPRQLLRFIFLLLHLSRRRYRCWRWLVLSRNINSESTRVKRIRRDYN